MNILNFRKIRIEGGLYLESLKIFNSRRGSHFFLRNEKYLQKFYKTFLAKHSLNEYFEKINIFDLNYI